MRSLVMVIIAAAAIATSPLSASACSPPPLPPPNQTPEEAAAREALIQKMRDEGERHQVGNAEVVYIGRILSVETPRRSKAKQVHSTVVISGSSRPLRGDLAPRRLRFDAVPQLCGGYGVASLPGPSDVGREILVVLGDPIFGPWQVQELVFPDQPLAQRLMALAAETPRSR